MEEESPLLKTNEIFIYVKQTTISLATETTKRDHNLKKKAVNFINTCLKSCQAFSSGFSNSASGV
jgi:hypothetical protein